MRPTLPLLALDQDRLLQRTLETIPGLLSWGTLIGLTILAFAQPLAVAVFLIFYDFYWLVRAFYVGTHLVAGYRTLRRNRGTNWLERAELLENPDRAVQTVTARIRELERRTHNRHPRRERQRLQTLLRRERDFLNDLQTLQRADARSTRSRPRWHEILHLVVLPTYNEPLSLLTQSIEALAAANYPKERLWVVVALEERAGAHAADVQRALHERYAQTFGRFLTTVHPDGIAGERQVKSANATYAARQVQHLLDEERIPYERVIVSNLDADSVVAPDYFGALTYIYLVTPDRLRCSYQPIPLYHNNLWEAPAFTRIVSMNATFWQLVQFVRPEKLVTFSSHAMPFRALVDVGFWDPSVVSEDSRIFWQCYIHYRGNYRTVPLHTTVSMDVTCAPTMARTFLHQYKQIRRWAWGVENTPFVAKAFLRHRDIPLRDRGRRLFTMVEGMHSWATAPLILALLGWIPILFGDADFQRTVLAFSLPRVIRTLLTISTIGLILNTSLSLLLLPPAPVGTRRRQYLWMVLQWAIAPITASILGAIPALDAQTRLLFGKYLGFWVTPKERINREPIHAPVLAAARR